MSKTALITGASCGIGYEIAKIFALNGVNLVLVARNLQKLNSIKTAFEDKYNISVVCCAKDLSLPNSAKEVFDEICQKNITVDYLVNNAGFGDNGSFLDRDLSVQENMINLNVLALTQLCHLFGNEMRKNKSGKILNISSMAAFCSGPYMSVYFASKAFVLSFSEALAEELKNDGVFVTCLCPGPTETNFAKAAECSEANMFKLIPVASAKSVAECGYRALMKGKTLAYHGITVKGFSLATRLSPRKLNAKATGFFTQRK